jgi:hypothetical protein
MACPRIEGCPLYPELKLELSLRIWQTNYCNTDAAYERCARYQLSAAGEKPHPRLLPNGEILGELKR